MGALEFGTIKAVVDDCDPKGLLADGAPRNEYDYISRIIVRGFQSMLDEKGLSKEKVQEWVFYVFERQFGPGEPPARYEKLAGRLWDLCSLLNLPANI